MKKNSHTEKILDIITRSIFIFIKVARIRLRNIVNQINSPNIPSSAIICTIKECGDENSLYSPQELREKFVAPPPKKGDVEKISHDLCKYDNRTAIESPSVIQLFI